MLITRRTKYSKFLIFEGALEQGAEEKIMRAAEQQFKPCAQLTINEFFGCLSGDLQLIGDAHDPTVYQVYWVKRFKQFCDQFSKSCEALSFNDPENEGVQTGCVKMQPQESVMTFLREYFNLPSFTQAAELTIGEYILARKDAFNKWKMRKNFDAKQLAKLKQKK